MCCAAYTRWEGVIGRAESAGGEVKAGCGRDGSCVLINAYLSGGWTRREEGAGLRGNNKRLSKYKSWNL